MTFTCHNTEECGETFGLSDLDEKRMSVSASLFSFDSGAARVQVSFALEVVCPHCCVAQGINFAGTDLVRLVMIRTDA